MRNVGGWITRSSELLVLVECVLTSAHPPSGVAGGILNKLVMCAIRRADQALARLHS